MLEVLVFFMNYFFEAKYTLDDFYDKQQEANDQGSNDSEEESSEDIDEKF